MSSSSKKVALGMSGGVDSSLCAHLLVEQGYEVTGVYLECWSSFAEATKDKRARSTRSGCTAEQDRKDALKVALDLGIPFQVLDFKQAYKEKVVENFFQEYEAGRTPNPDVLCNKEIKFGLFYDWAMTHGFDFVATGHYARIRESEGQYDRTTGNSGKQYDSTTDAPSYGPTDLLSFCPPALQIPADAHKDQTYFLYRLRSEQLDHILFPLSELTKSQVRAEAERRGIAVAQKPDSQGICFIGDINVHNFLRERLGEREGDVVNTSGEVMGRHKGLWFYTVGQRHGFEIFGKWKSAQGEVRHALPPYYVISKIPETNQLVVGFGAETQRVSFEVEDVHWIGNQLRVDSGQLIESSTSQEVDLPTANYSLPTIFVRIRHGGELLQVKSVKAKGKRIVVELVQGVKGIADGQSAVLYRRTVGRYEAVGQDGGTTGNRQDITHNRFICLGGGIIVS